MAEHAAARLHLSGLCFFLQLLTIVLFATFVRYSPESSNLCSTEPSCSQRDPSPTLGYPRFRDAHLRALLGFGFLLAFLSRYGVGSVAGSLLIVAFTIQWAILAQGLFYFSQNGKIYVSTQSMVSADFCTAAILISTGAVLGRVNPIQMLLMALLEVPLFACNEYILRNHLGVSDSGGSLTIHTFGAYFGLTVSRVLHQLHKDKRKEQQDMGHQPDVFAVVGTICLWIFWPSFASATTTHSSAEPWAVLNLYFSLSASTLATFVLSPILYEEGTLQVAQLQDATLASAAVMGMAGEMLSTPFGALTAGFLASQLSLLGSRFLSLLSVHPPAHPAIQAENRGHVRSAQRPRAAGDPGHLPGDTAGSVGHCGCIRRQVRRAGTGERSDMGAAPVPPPWPQAEPRAPFPAGCSSSSRWWPTAAARPLSRRSGSYAGC
ncbi:ammonium transporter Rh type B isoform X3 [Phasianus colchicus]|uniref:ammonium transporter Rh type B isoform X3 n=1 Tax=Phasianus colchicus TaxID=9054 RepID=UPI00129E468B|nr:ammonium transporter Rh type B isoform X3 [Phasianus colchicus]